MKAAPFSYTRVHHVDEAVDALATAAQRGEDARVLAGGQSLVPLLAMRLSRPSRLIDINPVRDLARCQHRDGRLVVGALGRQRQVERSPAARAVPLLVTALPYVGHRELRNRGTVVGSLAHADPAAELPAVAALVGATVSIAGRGGTREEDARNLITGPFETGVAPDELLVSVSFPERGDAEGYGFAEVARRRGDFALVGVAARIRLDGDVPVAAEVALFGVGGTPVLREVTDQMAAGPVGDPRLPARVGEEVAATLEPPSDTHASGTFRRRLARVLVARTLAAALDDATGDRP
ncbi:MAG TPA: FAD binding domain-containing protein [Acidimicrobiales bacterium]|jgi:carbon-monoxide dehydrogenase medium subunit|nr:FAD binding domain-containing protein [Acidimicrobiales bacterium]